MNLEVLEHQDVTLHNIKPDVPMSLNLLKKDGFHVRIYTLRKDSDIIKQKYVVCNKMGKPKMNLMERNTIYKVIDCKAKIIMKHVKEMGEYSFDKFQEIHNHKLEDTFHLKISRSLSYSDKELISRASIVKMGATKAYNLKSTLKGGFEHVRGKDVDYKIFKRGMGSIIRFKDAHLIVNKMTDRKNNYPNYSFYYICDENQVLNTMYALIFVPFTVINHYKSFVTVGARLLSTKDVDS
uniref:FAR1 domain-containing protein n=1 Tax=Lactuca sativa TaxID=4236 RepID=A0A9R1VDC3_LACSA|nr:hypothetical protein LSAT_V11C500294410 [Lactuca sativa]